MTLRLMQTSLQLGSKLLRGLGVMSDDVTFLRQLMRDSMELQAQEELNRSDDRESDVMKPLQVIGLLLHLCYYILNCIISCDNTL